LKKHNNSRKKSELPSKRAKSRGPVQRDTKEVLAELVGKLKEKLDPKKVAARSAGEEHERGELRPNLDRLTVGVDLGDQWSHYCILDLEGETLAEGQLRTTQQSFAEFFQALNAARVVFEVGTHSAWIRDVICSCGHEVLVANPRLMEGSKRRMRKNDRIDSNCPKQGGPIALNKVHFTQHCRAPFSDPGRCMSNSSGQYCGGQSSNRHQLFTPLNAGCTRERLELDGNSWRAYCKTAAVSLYMCRGGLPASGVSQRVSKSARSRSRSAKRIRIGYKVPDFSPVFRLMS
jgi:Transposase